MGNKNIKKEVKKAKKSTKTSADTVISSISSTPKPVVVQPVLIKKEKKTR